MMNRLIDGKTIDVMVFVAKGTSFDDVNSVFGYAVRGNIKRVYTEAGEIVYRFSVYPSQVECFIFECKEHKIKVRILD